MFQSSVAIDPRDTAAIPDFPRAAELAASIVGTKWKEKFDGVIGVDPITMAYMLRGLGPINVGDNVTINSRNAVQTLLNGVYLKYPKDPSKQDDVFKAAARRIFNATVSGKGKSQTVIRALVQGVTERRLMLWSRDDERAEADPDQRHRQRAGPPERPSAGGRVRRRRRVHQDAVLPGHAHDGPLGDVSRR